MRVALVHTRFGGIGGTEGYIVQVSRFLVEAGHAVDVWCLGGDRDYADSLGVRLVCEEEGRGFQHADRRIYTWSRSISRDDYDVIHGSGRCARHDVFRAGGGVHDVWLRQRDSSVWSKILAAFRYSDRWASKVDRAAVTQARRVVCNSVRVSQEMRVVHGVSKERSVVIRNGVDRKRFQLSGVARAAARERIGVPSGGRVALFLGNGFRRKGLAVATQAFARVSGPRDRLVILGRDAHARRWLAPARRQLGQRLVVVGPVADPETWLVGADATVLPTLYDAAANSTLESLAAGVPAVTSAMDGSSEVVPEPALVVTDPRDVAGFSDALDHAWQGGAELSDRCRDAVAAQTWEACGQALLKVYAEVTHG